MTWPIGGMSAPLKTGDEWLFLGGSAVASSTVPKIVWNKPRGKTLIWMTCFGGGGGGGGGRGAASVAASGGGGGGAGSSASAVGGDGILYIFY